MCSGNGSKFLIIPGSLHSGSRARKRLFSGYDEIEDEIGNLILIPITPELNKSSEDSKFILLWFYNLLLVLLFV